MHMYINAWDRYWVQEKMNGMLSIKRKPVISWNVTFLKPNKHLALNKFKYFTISLSILKKRGTQRSTAQHSTEKIESERERGEKKIIFFNVPKKWGNKNLHNFCQNRLSRQRNFCNAPFSEAREEVTNKRYQ